MLDSISGQLISPSVKKRKARRSLEAWRQLIKTYELGTMEQAAFCKEHNISVGSLTQWIKKLGSLSSSKATALPTNAFVELCPSEVKASSNLPCHIELLLPHGMILKINT